MVKGRSQFTAKVGTRRWHGAIDSNWCITKKASVSFHTDSFLNNANVGIGFLTLVHRYDLADTNWMHIMVEITSSDRRGGGKQRMRGEICKSLANWTMPCTAVCTVCTPSPLGFPLVLRLCRCNWSRRPFFFLPIFVWIFIYMSSPSRLAGINPFSPAFTVIYYV